MHNAHVSFNKCPIYDGASAKFSTNSHETDNSVHCTGSVMKSHRQWPMAQLLSTEIIQFLAEKNPKIFRIKIYLQKKSAVFLNSFGPLFLLSPVGECI